MADNVSSAPQSKKGLPSSWERFLELYAEIEEAERGIREMSKRERIMEFEKMKRRQK